MEDLVLTVLMYVSSHFERGRIFFVEDLEETGIPSDELRVVLSRIVNAGPDVVRLARGVYCYPYVTSGAKVLLPSDVEVADALAARWRVRIAPCGAQAAYLAGFTSLCVAPLVFVSNGSYQVFNLQGGRQIVFRRRKSNKVFFFRSDVMRNLVEGLRWVGKERVGDREYVVVADNLVKVSREDFEHDLKLAPLWIREILRVVAMS